MMTEIRSYGLLEPEIGRCEREIAAFESMDTEGQILLADAYFEATARLAQARAEWELLDELLGKGR